MPAAKNPSKLKLGTVKNVSTSGRDLADGRIVLAGRKAKDVDLDDPHNAALIAERVLLVIDEKPAAKPAAKETA